MTTCPEIFFGHVTEPELAMRLGVSIGSRCLPTFLPFVRNRTRRVVSDYCEQGRRFCAITPISSALDLQLPRGITLQFTRPVLGASFPPAERLPLYGRRSPRILLRLFTLSLTPGMEVPSFASALHSFICKVLIFGSRWVDGSPISMETIQRQFGLAIRAIFDIFERRNVAQSHNAPPEAVFLLQFQDPTHYNYDNKSGPIVLAHGSAPREVT